MPETTEQRTIGQVAVQHRDSTTPQADAGDHAHRDAVWERLLAWYAAEGRATLPWRHTRDPYAVLVSETMLQQTQVERVLPKYAEFLEQFPTLERLAAAPVAEVIQAWRGLGYNMRAVRLWRVARQVVAEYSGRLPETVEGLMRLAGIGRYTAGAIACFAFGLPVATVDTNIRRVLWRVFRGIEPARWPEGVAARRVALALAEWALPPDHAYDWQQALMDLGASVCVSRRPACERCPLAGCCAAYAETARVALFPSGEVLARLREERATLNADDAEGRGGRGGRGAEREGDGEREGREERAKDAKRERGKEEPQWTRRGSVELGASGSKGQIGSKRVAETHAPYGAGRGRKAREPFEQSARYFRGRAVDALRALPPCATLPLAELGALIRPSYTADDEPWLRTLVAGLVRDGLARVAEEGDQVRVGLP